MKTPFLDMLVKLFRKILLNRKNFIYLKNNYLGSRAAYPINPTKIYDYFKCIDTSRYSIYTLAQYGDKVIAAYGDMVVVQKFFNKNNLVIYPFFQKKSIKYSISLNAKIFPNLIPNSTIFQCVILPYMRVVAKNKYEPSLRIVIITDKAQIYHNNPARSTLFDSKSQLGDFLCFEESVIWDLPGHKHPTNSKNFDSEIERYFPNLPSDCYDFHPVLNTDSRFLDSYTNGGFGKYTFVNTKHGKKRVSRFYIPQRNLESNPFHFVGTGDKEYKMTLLATYRSNTRAGVRTCVFATSDGGRQWFCKYEFSDYGDYDFRQGDINSFGTNFGNVIVNDDYDKDYSGGLFIKKRNLLLPNESNKDPKTSISWQDVGEVSFIEDNSQLILHTISNHGLRTGNIISLVSVKPQSSKLSWMICNDYACDLPINNLLFKIKVLSEKSIALYELVSTPDNTLPCRHVHHVNRVKDGWILGTGEIYPNSWLLYFQMKEADTFSIKEAFDDFEVIRFNTTANSVQRTMGMILYEKAEPYILFASDHDLLERKEYYLDSDNKYSFSRNSTGIYYGCLKNIDDFKKFNIVLEMSEPCFYFQKLDNMLLFGGQRGELGLSFDDGKTWIKDRISSTLVHFYGNNGQFYYFDNCILYRKF